MKFLSFFVILLISGNCYTQTCLDASVHEIDSLVHKQNILLGNDSSSYVLKILLKENGYVESCEVVKSENLSEKQENKIIELICDDTYKGFGLIDCVTKNEFSFQRVVVLFFNKNKRVKENRINFRSH